MQLYTLLSTPTCFISETFLFQILHIFVFEGFLEGEIYIEIVLKPPKTKQYIFLYISLSCPQKELFKVLSVASSDGTGWSY